MTTYTYPNIRPSSQAFSFEANTAIYTSPFNGTVSTQDRDGERWAVEMSYDNLQGDRKRQLLAFMMKLNGAQHRFLVGDFSYSRAGAGGGTPLVNGGSQTGKSLAIDGCPNNVTGWLLAGDRISVEELMYQVDEDVNTDGSGNATLTVTPRIFIAPSNNAAIEIDSPINRFVLDTNSLRVQVRPPDIAQIAFRGVSAING